MADYIPKQDTQFQDWLGNFLLVANANLAGLGLIAGDITPITTDKGVFDTTITDSEAKRAASRAATYAKDTVRKSAETKVRAIVRRIQANPAVSDEMKGKLQITIPGSQPTPPSTPEPPEALFVKYVGNSNYELSWKRGSNIGRILYVIEAIIGNSTNWIQLFSTGKTKYLHTGNVPGLKIVYRVKAQRGETQSIPSVNITVNEGSPV